MKKESKNYPQTPGYYWAAVGADNINTAVKVSGEAPFFTVAGYVFDVDEIRYFGNKIEED